MGEAGCGCAFLPTWEAEAEDCISQGARDPVWLWKETMSEKAKQKQKPSQWRMVTDLKWVPDLLCGRPRRVFQTLSGAIF